jgi:hypothetical protein
VRETVAGELPGKGRVAAAMRFDPLGCIRSQVMTTSLQPFPPFSTTTTTPLAAFPRHLFTTAVPFAVAEDIAIQEKTLQYTISFSPVAPSIYIFRDACTNCYVSLGKR